MNVRLLNPGMWILLFSIGSMLNFLTGAPGINAPNLGLEKNWYSILEYSIIQGHSSVFVLNQPYDREASSRLLEQSGLVRWHQLLIDRLRYTTNEGEKEHLGLRISPGISTSENDRSDRLIMTTVDGVITIGDALLVNRFRLNDAAIRTDPDFHGDTGEWLFGYFDESYAFISIGKTVDLFAGRMKRNLGAPNDYSLILSDNPYTFDHFGFTATGDRLKYSFFTTRLNDITGRDSQGVTMPADTVMKTRRYWALQRFDWKVSDHFQMAFTEATVYGGPDQNWVASYMNPVQFFYAAQRNQRVQLNSMWQINIFLNPMPGLAFYADLFADDLIINNEEIPDRDRHPDRLGILLKTSMADLILPYTLTTLRYARIWNDTYTSYRTFENYTYFNKGIGFPVNSYEGVKLTWDWFGMPPLQTLTAVEIWQQGDVDIHQIFDGEIRDFPKPPVTYGLTGSLGASLWQLKNIDVHFTSEYRLSHIEWDHFFKNASSDFQFNLRIFYSVQYSY